MLDGGQNAEEQRLEPDVRFCLISHITLRRCIALRCSVKTFEVDD